jgi:hypothetical protein
MADSNSVQRFPAPYVESIRESDPVVIRVDQDFGEIGSRPSQAPKDVRSSRMGIAHVGDSISGATRSNNSDNR